MENAAARGKLALALPIVGANLKNQQRPQRKKSSPYRATKAGTGGILIWQDMVRYGNQQASLIG